MLVITSIPDLLKYLQTRKSYAEKQQSVRSHAHARHCGMVYAFDEAIRAVEALINHQTDKDSDSSQSSSDK